MSKRTETIIVDICIPTTVELVVSWNDAESRADIVSMRRSMIQYDICAYRIAEFTSEEDLEYIDEEARKVLDIEDGWEE